MRAWSQVGRQVCVFRRDVTHIAPRNQIKDRRRYRGRRWKALQSSSICHWVVGGDHELDCDGFVTVGADVYVMRSSCEEPTSPPGTEVLRNTDVIAVHENLRCGRCNVENQPAQGRGLHSLRRRLWLCWDGRPRLRCVVHHHRPTEVGGPTVGGPEVRGPAVGGSMLRPAVPGAKPVLGQLQPNLRQRQDRPREQRAPCGAIVKCGGGSGRTGTIGMPCRARDWPCTASGSTLKMTTARMLNRIYSTFIPRSSINRRRSAAVCG